MNEPIIRVESLGKRYLIGEIGASTIREAAVACWSGFRRRPGGRGAAAVPPASVRDGAGQDRSDRELWALKDVTFDVKQGEVLGIIGRNGAGKSTLLKILSRITEPTHGRAVIRGRGASLLEVGTGFHPELTGRDNIYLNGAILGMKKSEIARKFDEIVAFAEVERFIDTPVKRYSSGMYVRLAFAVAAHLEPEILIVDEVLAVGDVSFQRKCLGRMKDVAQEGRTVLFVSHNMDAVLNLCSRGLFLHKGGCAYLGSVEGAVEAYLGSVDVQADGLVDLTNHAGRPSGMHSILRGVGIRVPGSSAYTNRLKTGDDLELEIRYDTGPDFIDLAQLGFCSITGMRLFTVGTHLAPDFNPVLRGVGVLTCRVPALPLVGGEYSISIMIGQGTPPHNLDCVDHAIRFHVETADYFGTGRTPLPSQGFWAQKADWRVEEGTRGLT